MEILASWFNRSNRTEGHNLRGSSSFPPWSLPWLPEAFSHILYWAPELAVMSARVRLGDWRSDEDSLWREAKSLIRSMAYDSAPGRRFMDLCSAGKLSEYNERACAPGTFGAIRIRGIPADAYFCGSKKSGIDWSRPFWGPYTPPVKDVCNATAGTAYDADGICGRWSTKQLVQSFFYAVPLWGIDPVIINAPSFRCLLGLGNCDIYYCQNCPGRCD